MRREETRREAQIYKIKAKWTACAEKTRGAGALERGDRGDADANQVELKEASNRHPGVSWLR